MPRHPRQRNHLYGSCHVLRLLNARVSVSSAADVPWAIIQLNHPVPEKNHEMKKPRKISGLLRRLRHLQHAPPSDEERHKRRAKASARYGGMGERELQLRMELILENFISDRSYRTLDTAKRLSKFSLSAQERFCNAAEGLATHSRKLAYHFFLNGVPAITSMNDARWNEWLQNIEATMREAGEDAAIRYLQNLDDYLQATVLPQHAVKFEGAAPVIEHLVTALGGRQLKVSKGNEMFTDTEQIFLPGHCSLFSDQEKNFGFYKGVAVFLWAQTRFGTWQIDMTRLLYELADHGKSLRLFQTLENLRLDACIARELPGVGRTLDELGKQARMLPDDKEWQAAARTLEQPDATAHHSLEMIESLYQKPLPEATTYQGVFKPAQVIRVIKRRIAAERIELQEKLSDILSKAQISQNRDQPVLKHKHEKTGRYRLLFSNDGEEFELTPEVRKLLESVDQDLGEIPEDYLRVGKGVDPAASHHTQTPQEKNNKMLLPEWDHSIRRYRPNWCQVFLQEVSGKTPDFANATLKQHRNLVKRLRRTFEALRNESTTWRGAPHGDDIDIDAAISAFIDARRREEPDPGVYIKRRKTRRNIAAAFLVDMSASTKGWINKTEKEALVLLCESLEKIGDRYAIYGFSGNSRKRCDIFGIKSFDENYGDGIKSRIGEIQPRDYTRMGAAIRFVCNELMRVEAKTRVMIAISDGRPDDADGYRGRYGIEDTRRALLEANFKGVHSYCITIDAKAADYLPYMYGRSNFSIVDRVEKLPYQMPEIYRRVTS